MIVCILTSIMLQADLQDERSQREHLQETLSQMYIWMQNVGTQVSIPPPQLQFHPPPRQQTPVSITVLVRKFLT